MTEMVERVAKAIHDLGYGLTENLELTIANAAIAAMREPTAAMIKAAGNGELDSWIKEDWQDMIDEALKR
jgi:hypothetical protein